MIPCADCRERMAEALYGELGESQLQEFEAHVRECAECAMLYQGLRATVDTMNRRRRPDPGADFWDGYWRRLEERVAREDAVVDASRFARRRSLGSWGYRVAAAVLVLAAGVWIGRTALAPDRTGGHADTPVLTQAPAPPAGEVPEGGQENAAPAVELPDDQQEAPAKTGPIDAPPGELARRSDTSNSQAPVELASGTDEAARRYLDRSHVLLLAVLNAGANGGAAQPASYSAERQRAGTLAAEGRKLQDELTGRNDRRLRELVGQLEMILTEIANLEADSDLEAVDMIRNRVDREGVLLRIDLEQMREAAPQTEPGKRAGGAID